MALFFSSLERKFCPERFFEDKFGLESFEFRQIIFWQQFSSCFISSCIRDIILKPIKENSTSIRTKFFFFIKMTNTILSEFNKNPNRWIKRSWKNSESYFLFRKHKNRRNKKACNESEKKETTFFRPRSNLNLKQTTTKKLIRLFTKKTKPISKRLSLK